MTNAEGMKLLAEFVRDDMGCFENFLEEHTDTPEEDAQEILENLETLAEGGQLSGGV